MKLLPYRLLTFPLILWVIYADQRVGDRYGVDFWVIAALLSIVFSIGPWSGLPARHPWLRVTWAILTVMAIAVLIIRLVLGYTR